MLSNAGSEGPPITVETPPLGGFGVWFGRVCREKNGISMY